MATIADQLTQLQNDKQTLVNNLVAKGIEATSDETFTTLVPKVNDIQTGGGDISEYFETTYSGTSPNNWIRNNFIKKVPDLVIDDSVTSLRNFCSGFLYAPKIICNSNITNMDCMYSNNTSPTIDVSGLNTSNVVSMYEMFSGCSSLTSLDLSNFNTHNAKSLNSMFKGCKGLTSLDLSNFDTSNVEDYGINALFSGCSKLVKLDVSKWNTNKVKYMNYLFENCSSLTSLDVSNWSTNKLTNVQQMFRSCVNLTSLDLSNFTMNTSVATYQSEMFSGCSSLTSLNLSNFNVGKNSYTSNMFMNCSSLTNLDIRNFDFTNVTSYSNMFKGVPADCLIIVKDDKAKEWITSKFTTLTNVKTVAEL